MIVRIGEHLVDREFISPHQLHQALGTQQRMGGRLGTNLIELGFVDADRLGHLLAELYGLPPAPGRMLAEVDPAVLNCVPAELAMRHMALPLTLADGTLHVATTAPRRLAGLSSAVGRRVMPWISAELPLVEAIARHYGLRLRPRYVALSS